MPTKKKKLKKLTKDLKETFTTTTTTDKNLIQFKTGSDLIDSVVGGGVTVGYPGGRIINLVGDKSSGKTFLALEIVANAFHTFKEKFKWVYDDCESGFTHDTKSLYGFEIMPIKRKDRTRSETVEDLYGNVSLFFESLKPDEYGIYVIDSLDGLSSNEMKKRSKKRINAFKSGKEFNEGSYQMGKPKFLSQEFFPEIADIVEQKNGLLVIVSQTRDKIDSLFKSQTRAGGKALDFYCHTVLWLSSFYKIKKKERAVGVVIKAHAKKSKTPRPFRQCVVSLYFDYGIDNVGSNLDFLFDLRGDNGILKSNSKKIVWDEGAEEPTIKKLVLYIRDIGIEDEYKKYFDNLRLKNNEKKEAIITWMEENYKDYYLSKFGESKNRKELIKYIEDNNLENKLTLRVREKWESIEQEIKTDRKKRYL